LNEIEYIHPNGMPANHRNGFNKNNTFHPAEVGPEYPMSVEKEGKQSDELGRVNNWCIADPAPGIARIIIRVDECEE